MSTQLKPFRSMHGEMAVSQFGGGLNGVCLQLTQSRIFEVGGKKERQDGFIQLSRNDCARLSRRLALWLENTKPEGGAAGAQGEPAPTFMDLAMKSTEQRTLSGSFQYRGHSVQWTYLGARYLWSVQLSDGRTIVPEGRTLSAAKIAIDRETRGRGPGQKLEP